MLARYGRESFILLDELSSLLAIVISEYLVDCVWVVPRTKPLFQFVLYGLGSREISVSVSVSISLSVSVSV